ncbi:hypothetical protein D9Q98_007876 [Chlorella vulgaris]|uniref:Uncharacterized protein n=1 Tax=Chlorella vulgaris TaxID=3077 RepID=A0A9D4THQ3_CHLVU|nr:hypothetical protein D9Q98_007876 [Chlorella vulgaris]
MAAPPQCGAVKAAQQCCFALYNKLHINRSIIGPAQPQPLKAVAQRRRRRQASLAASRPRAVRVQALRNFDQPQALLFDCDGVLVDTEAEGHRVAFNEAFKRKGLQHEWSLEQYGVLLETGGGKERMDVYFTQCADQEPWASVTDPAARKAFLKELHELKTDIFNTLIETGSLPVRPGVKRLIDEAIDSGITVAVCSTSNERAVSNIVKVMLGDRVAQRMRVFAGDCVPKKKPAPDIYLLAAQELGVEPARCVVIEDSRIGLAAAKAAGMRCVVTESYYTKGEDFKIADAVFDCIGEAGDERFSLSDLTTPGSFWLNPPLPMDEEGNWYNPPVAPEPAFDVDPVS